MMYINQLHFFRRLYWPPYLHLPPLNLSSPYHRHLPFRPHYLSSDPLFLLYTSLSPDFLLTSNPRRSDASFTQWLGRWTRKLGTSPRFTTSHLCLYFPPHFFPPILLSPFPLSLLLFILLFHNTFQCFSAAVCAVKYSPLVEGCSGPG